MFLVEKYGNTLNYCIDEIFTSRAVLQDEPGIVKRATHRVGLLTGLATKWSPVMHNAEPFQIVNYGIGGMYHPHYDSNVSVWNKNVAWSF